MPITARTHASMHVNTVRMHGLVTTGDFLSLVDFYTAASSFAAKIDAIYVFERGVVLDGIDRAFLVAFKQKLVAALASVKRQVIIRTALVVREPSALPAIAAWTVMSEENDGLFSDPRIVEHLAEACAWLGLGDAEARTVKDSFDQA